MNVVLITIAIIIIIICIYFVISYTNNNFKNFITSLKPSSSQTTESFTSHPKENCENDSIGIVFHKFMMNRRYNVESLDEVYLSDYCSKEYLERNFVNIVNDLWDEVGFNFYLKEIVEENEVENLMKYYLYTPEEYVKYPPCKDQTRYLKDQINNERDPPTFDRIVPSCAKFTRVIFEDINNDPPATFKKIFTKESELDGNEYAHYTNKGEGITLSFNADSGINRWETNEITSDGNTFILFSVGQTSTCPTPELNWKKNIITQTTNEDGTTQPSHIAVDTNIKIRFDLDSLYPEPVRPTNSLIYPYFESTTSSGSSPSPGLSTFPSDHGIPKIDDAKKKQFSQLDVFILKEYLSDSKLLSNDNANKVVASIFTRMTDESQYQKKHPKDIHIYLMPYIEADNVIILEGRNNTPLVLVSMFYKDCNQMKRVFENFNNDKLCRNWLSSLMSSYNSLTKLEDDYNEISKFDLTQDPNKHCKAKVLDTENSDYARSVESLIDEEKSIINEIAKFKKNDQYKNINMWKQCIQRNTEKMREIYEYDYFKDQRVKVLKQFKGRTGPFMDPNPDPDNPRPTEMITNYQTMVELTVNQIKKEQKIELQRLKRDNDEKNGYLNKYNSSLKPKEDRLVAKQSQIANKLEYKNDDLQKLKVLKKMIDQKKKEINVPMMFAEKAKPIININLTLVSLFDTIILPSGINKTKNLYKDLEACQILDKPFDEGGLVMRIDLRKYLINARKTRKFLKYGTAKARFGDNPLKTYIDAPQIPKNPGYLTLTNQDDVLGNKCDLLSEKTYINLTESAQMRFPHTICESSKNYEVLDLNTLDLDAQYYLINELVDKPELADQMNSPIGTRLNSFRDKLTNKCLDMRTDLRNPRAEAEYIRGESSKHFFQDSEAIENYKWLLNYYRKNKINLGGNVNRIIADIEKLVDDSSNQIMEGVKTTIFPPDDFEYDYDAITCPALNQFETDYSAFFGTDVTHPSLNSFVLEKQSCNNNYLDSFNESYI